MGVALARDGMTGDADDQAKEKVWGNPYSLASDKQKTGPEQRCQSRPSTQQGTSEVCITLQGTDHVQSLGVQKVGIGYLSDALHEIHDLQPATPHAFDSLAFRLQLRRGHLHSASNGRFTRHSGCLVSCAVN